MSIKGTGVIKHWLLRAEFKDGWRETKHFSWEEATNAFHEVKKEKPLWAIVWAVSRGCRNPTWEYKKRPSSADWPSW